MKQTTKKLLIVFASLLMIVSATGCQKASTITTIEKEQSTIDGPYAGKTIILHTNDIHGGYIPDENENTAEGGLEIYAIISAIKKDFESKGANVILIDDGDFSQGSIYVSVDKGAAVANIMDTIGYDISALGNHEFNYGADQLKSILEGKNYKVICSNVFKDDKCLFDSEAIFKIGDIKIGFFGLVSPETQTKANPNFVKGLSFASKQELYDLAQKEIDLLKKESDLVICLSHLGIDASSAGNKSTDVYANTTGIDFIIDGHSHTRMEKGDNGEPIQSTKTKGTYVGVIEIDNKTKTIENNYLLETKLVQADNEVLDYVNNIMSKVDEDYNAIFANTEVELDGIKEDVRSKETNMADLITDAMVWTILKDGSIDVPNEDVVAIINGGAIRTSIGIGGITKKDINSVLPFGNTLTVNYIKGTELLEALEASTFSCPESLGGFSQISGMEIIVDTAKEFDAGEEYPGSTYCKPNSINRVTITNINGKPFDETKTYAVISTNFMAAGGDTYYSFKRSSDAGDIFDTGITIDVVVMNYISEKLNGRITTDYQEAQKRIIIK